MFKKVILNSILFLLAFSAIVFPTKIDISASDKLNVSIDYNVEEIEKFLPANAISNLNNTIAKVSYGESVPVSSSTQTLNCYYRCEWLLNGNVININNYKVTEDISIIARWIPIEYTIHYMYLNNEEDEITNIEHTRKYTIEDGRIDYYRPNRKDYVFIDWYTSSTLNDQFLAIYKTEYGIGDVYLYAKWRPIEYKINYNTDSENIDNPPTYNVEHKGFELAKPTKIGFEFDGWYLDKDFTNKCTRIDSSFSGEINLYPKWTPKTYIVTYILPDGEVSKVNVNHGETCKLPEINKSIFEIVKTDVSRKNITGDTTINIKYVNIWYVYFIGLLLLLGVIAVVIVVAVRKNKNIHKLRYVYNTANKKTRGWR